MRQLLLLMTVLLMMAACRSKVKKIEKTDYKLHEAIKTDTNSVISEEKKIQTIEKEIKKIDQKIKENEGDIIIKGKTDSLKDFHFHNVIEGDTVSDIFITGNSDFIIKNRWKKVDKKETEVSESENINIVAKIARKAVAQSTIKDVAAKINTLDSTVKSKGFPVWIYGIIGSAVGLAIISFFVYLYFKK